MPVPLNASILGTALERWLVRGLWVFNGLLHIVLAVALVLASAMVVLEFFHEAVLAYQQDKLAQGFLHALGVLFIVWTLSSLISAEIEYVRTGRFHLRVFLEVAMITLLRQLIVRPVQAVAGDVKVGDWSGFWEYLPGPGRSPGRGHRPPLGRRPRTPVRQADARRRKGALTEPKGLGRPASPVLRLSLATRPTPGAAREW
ncbi:phosphate-starvation-inducible PsiE family protein [Pararhodospirillum photometricum]|uniref:phosphate-starvation-inducible PsiE family protein n=1 Tax=Pararhodospirillum photometricum TaxID=1084 RepID=UPI0002DF0547|nr:phosphate-starvation-inducible PsiE family protein [Pararhodospirillum photometricum]